MRIVHIITSLEKTWRADDALQSAVLRWIAAASIPPLFRCRTAARLETVRRLGVPVHSVGMKRGTPNAEVGLSVRPLGEATQT